MKTSARNQFAGTVSSVHQGAVNDEIELDIATGVRIVATVTRESSTNLGLKVGAKAFALIKASSVVLMTDTQGIKLSARNQLQGKVKKLTTGAVNSEVVLELPGGGNIVTIITNESAKTLGIAQGSSATAIFKATSVIIGVAA